MSLNDTYKNKSVREIIQMMKERKKRAIQAKEEGEEENKEEDNEGEYEGITCLKI